MELARKVAAVVLMVLTFGGAVLWVRSPLEPQAWTPPPVVPLEGPLAPNDALQPLEWWAKGLVGPEAITVVDGLLYAGLRDGRVVTLRPGSDEATLVVDTKGRPLAMAFHPDGRLIICDAHRGLLAWSPSAGLEVLATGFGGVPFRFVDDLAITRDGTIYFTDASARFSIEQFTEDLLEHQTTGRVLRYVPSTKELALVTDGLHFANGVALSADESFLVVSETGAYRLWRIPLTGPKAGQKEVFLDSLPGFPDNVRPTADHTGFWVALGSPRKADIEALAAFPLVRKFVGGLPRALLPKPARHAWVLRVDEQGRPVESLQHVADDSYSPIACVTEADGYLYLGSFVREGVARFKRP